MTQTMKQEEQGTKPYCRGCLAEVSKKIGEKDKYDLLRCENCGTVVVDPWPTVEELNAHYQNYFKTGDYMRKRTSKLRRSRKRVMRMINMKPPGKRFLDIGCSVGFMIQAAHDCGLEALGIDIDGTALEIAEKEFGDAGTYQQISAEELAETGIQFDMIYANDVIEHVPDPESFVAAVSKLLSPGGVFYVTAPDGARPLVPKDFASWGMVIPPDHLTYFSRKGMRQLLERHDLRVKKFQLSIKPGMKVLATTA